MSFASLGSGSRGNATLVAWPEGALLIDCGFSLKETEARLLRFGLTPADLKALLVTHEHGDHLKGIAPLARRYHLPVYMTPGTFQSRPLGPLPDLRLIHSYDAFELQGLQVQPVPVPHDAREPVQYLLSHGDRRLGVLTDLGSISPQVEVAYQDCDALILEANHDAFMLASGPYPYSLKQRVGGPWGHLSNHQAAGLLARLNRVRLQHLVIAHISQQNNALDRVQTALEPWVGDIGQVLYACQEQGFDWLHIR